MRSVSSKATVWTPRGLIAGIPETCIVEVEISSEPYPGPDPYPGSVVQSVTVDVVEIVVVMVISGDS